jgi:C1A family cysteine protease
MVKFIPPGLGWHRDLPDPRDWSVEDVRARSLLDRLKRPKGGRSGRPAEVDWREYFPPIDDQRQLASASAHACLGLVSYFTRRASGEALDGSRLFLYKTTRLLLDWPGDRGAPLRATLKAMVRFGIPPEHLWPYDVNRFDEEPGPFLYSFANEYRSMVYVRLDSGDASGAQTLEAVRSYLAAGFPCAFGLSLPGSLSAEPEIPAPTAFDTVQGGHAAIAVGYDDRKRIRSSKGALLIRNSWGASWGDAGYGWLPFVYFQRKMAVDVWTLLRPDWLESGEFEQPLYPS